MRGLRSAHSSLFGTFVLSLSLGGASSKKFVACPYEYEKN